MDLWNSRWLGIPYRPDPDEHSYLERAQVRQDEDLIVRASVLDRRESERFFGVPLARRGIQPVWVEIRNNGQHPYRLRLASLDASYYPPLEAAYVNHFRLARRLIAFGVLAWLFLPLLVLLPFKLLCGPGRQPAHERLFPGTRHRLGSHQARGQPWQGFVFTSLDEGTKQFSVRLLGLAGVKDFAFSIAVPGLRVDHHNKRLDELGSSGERNRV